MFRQIPVWLALAAFSCGDGNSRGTYVLELTGYGVHVGKVVELKVKNPQTGATLVGGTFRDTMPSSGALRIALPNILEEGVTYRVDYFADFDGDGVYTGPNGAVFVDHSWRRAIVGRQAGVSESHVHDQDWTDIRPF